MATPSDYLGSVFWQAIDELDHRQLHVRRRLNHAANHLMKLTADEFPADMQKAFKDLMFDLTADIRHGQQGAIESTTETMSDETANRLEATIRTMYQEIKRRGFGMPGDDA